MNQERKRDKKFDEKAKTHTHTHSHHAIVDACEWLPWIPRDRRKLVCAHVSTCVLDKHCSIATGRSTRMRTRYRCTLRKRWINSLYGVFILFVVSFPFFCCCYSIRLFFCCCCCCSFLFCFWYVIHCAGFCVGRTSCLTSFLLEWWETLWDTIFMLLHINARHSTRFITYFEYMQMHSLWNRNTGKKATTKNQPQFELHYIFVIVVDACCNIPEYIHSIDIDLFHKIESC